MQAGRELDALIAEKVMEGNVPAQFMPSKLISDAWQVVEHILSNYKALRFHSFEVGIADVDRVSDEWDACFFWGSLGEKRAFADSAPLAICLAALRAAEGEPDGV